MKKRAFVRYSKQGKIVPGSLVLTAGSYPQGSALWKEVPADLCCDNVVLATYVPNLSLTYISVRIRCNSTTVETLYSSESSVSIETLIEVLNQQFSELGTFAAAGTNAVTLTISPTKAKELGCEGGNLIFEIFED